LLKLYIAQVIEDLIVWGIGRNTGKIIFPMSLIPLQAPSELAWDWTRWKEGDWPLEPWLDLFKFLTTQSDRNGLLEMPIFIFYPWPFLWLNC